MKTLNAQQVEQVSGGFWKRKSSSGGQMNRSRRNSYRGSGNPETARKVTCGVAASTVVGLSWVPHGAAKVGQLVIAGAATAYCTG